MPVTVLVPDKLGVELLSTLDGVDVRHYAADEPLPDNLRHAEILVPPFLGPVRMDLVEALPRLRLVQLLTAGYEPWEGRLPGDVALCSGRGAHGGATAEWVAAVLLSLRRELPTFVRAQDRAEWAHQVTGTLIGSRVLVVGAGDVANEIVRRLTPFEVDVTLVGRTPREGVHGMDELPGLLASHDAVVLAVPLTETTAGLADATFLAAMPDGAILVNAARGGVADTDALVAELRSGRLRAAVDVTDPEPLPADHPLWTVPGVLITPHVGGSVDGRLRRAYSVAAQQVAAFLAGERPENLVS